LAVNSLGIWFKFDAFLKIILKKLVVSTPLH
jgi:hypothetical protein